MSRDAKAPNITKREDIKGISRAAELRLHYLSGN